MNNFKKGGLLPKPYDPRTLVLGEIVKFPELSELPEEFSLEIPYISDQIADGNNDMCSAYATCAVSAIQEGLKERFHEPFSFAASKKITGYPDDWGQTQIGAWKGHVAYGAVEDKEILPEDRSLSNSDRRRFDLYSNEAKSKALRHLKKAYVRTKGPYDAYDNIRATIWMYRAQKRAVTIGVLFGWSLYVDVLDGISSGGFGHMMYVIGWDKKGLIVVNSAGKSAGINGVHHMTRETIEYYVPIFDAYTTIDMTEEELKKELQAKSDRLKLIEQLYVRIIELWKMINSKKKLNQ